MIRLRSLSPFLRHTASGLRLGLALRLGAKGLLRAPGITLLGVAILTLGLAAPSTFFSLLVGAIRPLPVPEGDRIVRVDVSHPARDGRVLSVLLEDARTLQEAGSLESLGAFRTFNGTLREPGGIAARISGAALTPEVLPLLRVAPALGRIPDPSEASETLLLSHRLWIGAFDGDSRVLGRVVSLDGASRTVVGVLPEGFAFPYNQGAWTLLDGKAGDTDPVELVGRLAPEASLESASTEMSGLWRRGDGLRNPERAGAVLRVRGFTGGRGERGEGIAFLGLVMVALALLLIACSNVAHLLLVRATERARNLAVQSAVGASRSQIAAQLLMEALLLAVAGGLGGTLLASVAVDAIQRALAAEHFGYFWMRMAVDGRVMAFTALLVLGTALVAGLLPLLRVLRSDLQGLLKEEATGMSVGGGGAWSKGFVTVQLALSCGALVAAGLTGFSLVRGASFGEGLGGEEVMLASVTLPEGSGDERTNLLEAALSGLPNVEGVALAVGVPGFMERWSRVEVEGWGSDRQSDVPGVLWNAVSSGYPGLFGLTSREGRLLLPGDDRGAVPAAVVSESFARRILGGEEAVGRRVRVAGADTATWFTIVGVVEDLPLGIGPRERMDRVYLSLAQLPVTEVLAVMRRSGASPLPLEEVRKAVAEVDPDIPIWSFRTLADAYDYLLRVPRAMAGIACGGGVAGLLVAAVGLYGLLAFRVRQRRRELGLRLALGADGARLAREVMALALRQLVPAVAVGLALAWLLAPLIGVAVLSLEPRSPLVFALVAAAFLAVGMAAALVPALRAAALDPGQALRGK